MNGTQQTREKYDRLWSNTWGDLQHYGPVHRHQRKALLKLVAKLGIRSALDVGCGSGENLAALSQAMPEVTFAGADVSGGALAIAAKRTQGIRLYEFDVQCEKLDCRFDLVFSMQVIEHLANDVEALRNMAEMAAQWVLVTTIRGTMRKSERTIGHLRNYSDDELRQKAALAGLEIVDLFGWGFPFYSPIFRTLVEWLPNGPPQGSMAARQKVIAGLLYFLYGLNLPRRGDVVTMLARPVRNS